MSPVFLLLIYILLSAAFAAFQILDGGMRSAWYNCPRYDWDGAYGKEGCVEEYCCVAYGLEYDFWGTL